MFPKFRWVFGSTTDWDSLSHPRFPAFDHISRCAYVFFYLARTKFSRLGNPCHVTELLIHKSSMFQRCFNTSSAAINPCWLIVPGSIWFIDVYCGMIITLLIHTSSTAQGGGGSFKNRKPIGELGCCEGEMAERSHWWTERCLRSPLFLSLSLFFSDYLLTYQPIFYVSIYLSIFLSLSFSLSFNYLSTYLPIYLPTYLSIYPSIYLSISLSLSLFHLSICLAVYLSDYLSIYLSIYLFLCLCLCLSVSVSVSLSLSLLHLSSCLAAYLSIYLSVYLSICGAVSFSVM